MASHAHDAIFRNLTGSKNKKCRAYISKISSQIILFSFVYRFSGKMPDVYNIAPVKFYTENVPLKQVIDII